jgi:hypothetical protein
MASSGRHSDSVTARSPPVVSVTVQVDSCRRVRLELERSVAAGGVDR